MLAFYERRHTADAQFGYINTHYGYETTTELESGNA
jgi:hypothetical protein